MMLEAVAKIVLSKVHPENVTAVDSIIFLFWWWKKEKKSLTATYVS